jgi:hypothetical protein
LFEGNKIIFCYWNEMRRPNNFIYFEHWELWCFLWMA